DTFQLSQSFEKGSRSLGGLQWNFRRALGCVLNGGFTPGGLFRVSLWQFESHHHRVVRLRIPVNRFGKLVSGFPHFIQRHRELFHVGRLRLFFPRKPSNHLSERRGQRSGECRSASAARCCARRRHCIQKRPCQSRQLSVLCCHHR